MTRMESKTVVLLVESSKNTAPMIKKRVPIMKLGKSNLIIKRLNIKDPLILFLLFYRYI